MTYSDSLTLLVHMRSCELGESHQGDQCIICSEGQYSLDPEGSCQDCPTGAICYGDYTMVPKSGYWRSDKYSSTFWKCPFESSCLGSPEPPQSLALTGQCAEGYYGNLCNGCESGFSRVNLAECGKCPSFYVNAIRMAGIVVLILVFLALVVWSTIRSAQSARSHLSIYIKIFLNYLQLVMITANFSLNWPDYVSKLLEAQQTAGSAADQIFSIDCFVQTSSEEDQANTLRLKLVGLAFLPPLILALGLVIWLPVALWKGQRRYIQNEMVASCVVCFFLVHPSLVRFQFAFLNCKELTQGSYWLASYLNIRCWDSIHFRYVYTTAIPSVVVWAVGLPALCLMYLFRKRHKLGLVFLLLRLGFIYNGYIAEKYYWEFVIIYRKILLICIAVFFTAVSVYIQALTVIGVIVVALVLQSKHQPYVVPAMNELEQRGILVGGVTIYCGLYSLTEGLDQASQLTLFIVLVLANAYFLVFWVFKVGATGVGILRHRFKWLNDIFGRRYRVQQAMAASTVPFSSGVELPKLDDTTPQGNRMSLSFEDGSEIRDAPSNSRLD